MKYVQIVVFLLAVSMTFGANALTMQDLFRALKKQPVTKVDALNVKSLSYARKKTLSEFYPKIYGIASYEHYNSPVSLRPITPTESAEITRTGGSFAFSKDILSLGLKVDVPVFVYPLFALTKKALMLQDSARARKRLNFIRNEATIVVLNARLEYLQSLKRALRARIASLNAQLRTLKIAVKNGRAAGVSLLKIRNMIDQLTMQIDQIDSSEKAVVSAIETLTSIRLSKPVPMREVSSVKTGTLYSLKPLVDSLKAQSYEIEAKKGRLYPSVYLQASVFRKFGTAYNTGDSVTKNFGSVGVYLQVPLFDKTIYTDIQKAKSDYLKKRFQLEQTRLALLSEAGKLRSQLAILEHSVVLAQKRVENQKKLLKYAKVAFGLGRMTEEEFLRYESELVQAQADLYDLRVKKWEIITRLAVIYGNNLEEIVR